MKFRAISAKPNLPNEEVKRKGWVHRNLEDEWEELWIEDDRDKERWMGKEKVTI